MQQITIRVVNSDTHKQIVTSKTFQLTSHLLSDAQVSIRTLFFYKKQFIRNLYPSQKNGLKIRNFLGFIQILKETFSGNFMHF